MEYSNPCRGCYQHQFRRGQSLHFCRRTNNVFYIMQKHQKPKSRLPYLHSHIVGKRHLVGTRRGSTVSRYCRFGRSPLPKSRRPHTLFLFRRSRRSRWQRYLESNPRRQKQMGRPSKPWRQHQHTRRRTLSLCSCRWLVLFFEQWTRRSRWFRHL